ncbi:MAG: energy transducer TonB [Desulfobacteraceae bacterium]|nr:MAG: energy transducer TonB [Desulfobacteraceae bacterium]
MKRLFFSITLAFAFHMLIFCSDGEWLKSKPYKQAGPSSVAISLISLPPEAGSSDFRPLHPPEKKSDDMPENQSGSKERFPEQPAVKPELPGDSTQTDIAPASAITGSNAPAGSLPSPADNAYKAESRQNGPEGMKQAYGSPAGEIQTVSQVVKEAVPLYKENPDPVYPPRAKKRGYEGTVILEALVTKEGNAGKVGVFKSSSYSLLDEAAVSSVRKWRFEPGKRGDKKVDMTVKIPVRFQLKAD